MIPRHHPTDEHLVEYATGAMPEAVAVLVEVRL